MKTAFIGHRKVFANNIAEKLKSAIENEVRNGCKSFIMGTHGEFDRLALYACRQLRNTYKDLEIEVVITSLNMIKKRDESDVVPFSDVNTVMYDIEDAHYKQQITLSNRQMLNSCETLICYVDTSAYKSGAKTAMRYAETRGLRIINLYRKEDDLSYGMTKEKVDEYWKILTQKRN